MGAKPCFGRKKVSKSYIMKEISINKIFLNPNSKYLFLRERIFIG
jgi:hypothetical protein